tara:strand:+ start:749 stop:910 length:162 start_codon:yes stop_codon:yes gene_type:complete
MLGSMEIEHADRSGSFLVAGLIDNEIAFLEESKTPFSTSLSMSNSFFSSVVLG